MRRLPRRRVRQPLGFSSQHQSVCILIEITEATPIERSLLGNLYLCIELLIEWWGLAVLL